jgi:hypothetical protein
MRSEDSDDTRSTTDLGSPTVRIGDRYRDEDEPDLPPPGARLRGAKLWLPLVIFVVLLLAVALVGRFVLQSPETPSAGAAPTQASSGAPGPGAPTAAAPTLPDLPTPPARPADGLADWATAVSDATDIPLVAAEAYGYAQLLVEQSTPTCHISWTTLAGIGSVDSDHGQAGGAVLGSNGRSTPPINGPALDGKGGRTLVNDTDGGAYDGDPTYDRAMGPLQLLPSVWSTYRIDADGDGILDPYDIDDASAAVARLLCAGGEDLNTLTGWKAALSRYHAGTGYEMTVFQAADSYGQRTRRIG